MDTNNNLLEIRDLHLNFKVFGGTMKVLNGVDLEVKLGEKVGLVGESGCGKTTTVKSILSIFDKQAVVPKGKIVFDNKDVLKMNEKELHILRGKDLSMIFQDPTASLNPVFTIGQQMHDVIKYSGIVQKNDKKKINEISIKALKDCSMPDPNRILQNYPFQLSGGMRQRVCIAMALATANRLLIADEPTTNLDVTIQDQVLKLIHELVSGKGSSLILITHSLGVAREMTDKIYVMYAGNIVEKAPTNEIFESPLHPYTKGLLESIPKLTGEGMMEGIYGRLPNYLDPPKGCRFYPRCKYGNEECKNNKPPFYNVTDEHKVACFIYKDQNFSKGV